MEVVAWGKVKLDAGLINFGSDIDVFGVFGGKWAEMELASFASLY